MGGGDTELSQLTVAPGILTNPRQCVPSLCLALTNNRRPHGNSTIFISSYFGYSGAKVHGNMLVKQSLRVSPLPNPSILISQNGDPKL